MMMMMMMKLTMNNVVQCSNPPTQTHTHSPRNILCTDAARKNTIEIDLIDNGSDIYIYCTANE